MPPIISVQNLGKKYILSHQSQERYTALRDVIANRAKHLGYKLRHPFSVPDNDPTHEEFWALKDVSFDIQQGDRVGIIGRNGAGKSTLLKILSRITEPTSGRINIKGRVASLLEVGTGFHPELTGRENIFLNGAILGMSKAEIKKKFDEIVAFAEVEQFLDTPVKRYSSGMYVRLAFAVAAHLEPEILVVDEVLAVGDMQFQKKCLGKMEDVGKEGRTVLFVSHNMAAIEALCENAILLKQGLVVKQGRTASILDLYIKSLSENKVLNRLDELIERKGQGLIQFNKIQFIIDGCQVDRLITGKDVTVKLSFKIMNNHQFKNCRVGIAIKTFFSELMVLSTEMVMSELPSIDVNDCLNFHITKLPLSEGTYNLVLFLESDKIIHDWITDGLTIDVESADYYGYGKNHPDGYAGKTVLANFCCSKSNEIY